MAAENPETKIFGNGNVTIEDVHSAAERLRHFAHMTPVRTSQSLNGRTGKKLFMKCELFQATGSFKFRGALNAVSRLLEKYQESNRKPPVVAHSCGNHGLGLAYAAQLTGTEAYIVLPNTTPVHRRKAIESYGATIIESEPEYPEREAHVAAISKATGAVYIPTSQHPDVVAGQGTIALEFLHQMAHLQTLDAIVMSVSGGGMAAGIGIVAKTLQPDIKIIAAEPKNADDCYRSFRANQIVTNVTFPKTVADALTGNIGHVTWPILRDVLDDVITVSEQEIKDATKLIWDTMNLYIEPSAGVAVAAVLSTQFREQNQDLKNIGIILCGGNINLSSIASWIQ